MKPEIEKKYQHLRSLFFGLGIIAAVMLLLFSLSNITKSRAAEKWDVHEGMVTRELSRGLNYFGGTWLEYSYEVNGNKYQGTEIGYGISRPQTELKKGQLVRVYVNPANANEAVLEVGVARNHFIGLVFSTLFIWISLVIWRRTA
jgi:hypothetical protein